MNSFKEGDNVEVVSTQGIHTHDSVLGQKGIITEIVEDMETARISNKKRSFWCNLSDLSKC